MQAFKDIISPMWGINHQNTYYYFTWWRSFAFENTDIICTIKSSCSRDCPRNLQLAIPLALSNGNMDKKMKCLKEKLE